ncbi:hypothetical protein HMPREF0908_1288 [Selenomonas flueggei ATCC 43531]|uniref:Uncharacterized protein n=1 Tax=Selenomonas flueggei ATCC 43531 TaxID=638302 RepID=C4V444_9FIRM|nr:hypothetical protein HMPREF0908_1288 [Selenomonas flueggei ATCC 43531]
MHFQEELPQQRQLLFCIFIENAKEDANVRMHRQWSGAAQAERGS